MIVWPRWTGAGVGLMRGGHTGAWVRRWPPDAYGGKVVGVVIPLGPQLLRHQVLQVPVQVHARPQVIGPTHLTVHQR
jgi:predicted Rossmann-fold nucleotide-binding protein